MACLLLRLLAARAAPVIRHYSTHRSTHRSSQLDMEVLEKYSRLSLPECCSICTYIWIDPFMQLRHKTRNFDFVPECVSDLPDWNFDGSSTGMACGDVSDVQLKPVALYRDPLMPGKNNRLVLCETYDMDGLPMADNFRRACLEACCQTEAEEPWFGFEQEYVLLGEDRRPFAWPKMGYPEPQGPFYCGVGASKSFGRPVCIAHYLACLHAGVKVGGINQEVLPSQWEYQVGPLMGVRAADDLWMARFILYRIAEDFGLDISFDPKPVRGDWNGSGCHTNFSTLKMRQEGGIRDITEAVKRLGPKHADHMAVYSGKDGRENKKRLTGLHETAHFDVFTSGVADRNSSVRVPLGVYRDQKGYFEDRRPAGNMDPYRVITVILKTLFIDVD